MKPSIGPNSSFPGLCRADGAHAEQQVDAPAVRPRQIAGFKTSKEARNVEKTGGKLIEDLDESGI